VESYTRSTKMTELSNFCYLAKPDDFIEVTEWHNGEGYDIVINSQLGQQNINLTHGEISAIIHITSGFNLNE
jgi:hypothetical protein